MESLAALVEEKILDAVLSGKIRLDTSEEVIVWDAPRKRWITKKPNYHPKTQRCRYAFHHEKRTATIYKNRLVWIIVYRQLIPNGYYVDHDDNNRLNDHSSNLILMKAKESHAQGNELQLDRNLADLQQWFRSR